ncbi:MULTISPECIES: septum site-determining protein MinC [Clostridium]|uniref:Probable septum site-determining protein MinC n=1 Tax=Clostridium senegalense TaxID=1465809 RepID=A0A6M0GZQ7_9CLOT|nr:MULTISPECIES: septum site-determining protein MinC [Clostridium]NEU03374.1 septum site-determining protein MinC [Clostridium senegalense]
MQGDNIILKGNRDGLNVIIDINKFRSFEDMISCLIEKLSKRKNFYKGCTIKITTQIKEFTKRELNYIKDILFEKIYIKDCIFIDIEETNTKMFNGVYEGRTKYLRKSIRSGQTYEYLGNLVIIGDINPGAEVCAAGNIIVLGSIKGCVHAGCTGNEKAIIGAFYLNPQILKIANLMTISPDDGIKPTYPEIAKIKNGNIIVEPYLVNKYI